MLWTNIGYILAIAPKFISGQSTTSSGKPAAATISVSVGAAGHLFTPENITAKVGDIIEFRFYPRNHSVARSTFGFPCIPAEYHEGATGFWSGFYPLQTIPSQPPTFRVRVNDTNPIFFYCSAPGACEDGMVGVINAYSNQTLVVQKEFAHNATLMLSPGEPIPAEGTQGTATTSTTLSTSTSSTTTPVTSVHPGLSTGAIAGIVIGGVAVIVLAAALIYLCGRQRTLGEILKREHHSIVPPPYAYGPNSGISSPTHMTHVDDSLNNRFSAQTGPYSVADVGSYRTRSPGLDDGMGFGQGNPVHHTPEVSGIIAGFVPVSPRRTSGLPVQGRGAPARMKSQTGPHELGT